MKNIWQIQEAKNRLSEVIDRAWKSGRQTITKRHKPSVVVLSMDDYLSLAHTKPSLVDALLQAPWRGVKLDLKRIKDYPREQKL